MYHNEFEPVDKYLRVNNCAIQYLGDTDHLRIRPNGRRDFHILYIMSGTCHAVVGGTGYTATEGMVILFRPGERQEYRFFKQDDSVSLYIHFCGTGCEEYLKNLGLYELGCFYVGKENALVNALESMVLANELGERDEDVCASYFHLALALMARSVKYGTEAKRVDAVGTAVEYIARNLAENRPTEFYAAMCHMSKSRFEHIFKEIMGVAPRTYILKSRVDAAKRLVENTDLSNWEIAERVGIDDPNYFARVFKKYAGMTVGAWRRKNSHIV